MSNRVLAEFAVRVQRCVGIADLQAIMLSSALFFSILPKDARTMLLAYFLRRPPHVHDPAHLSRTETIKLSHGAGPAKYMCVAPDGCFVVCSGTRVLVFTPQGNLIHVIEDTVYRYTARACVVASDWTIYLSHKSRDRITVASARGGYGSSVSYTREFSCSVLRGPEGVGLSADERWLYVASGGTHRVCVFDTTSGEFTREFVVRRPCAVAVLLSGDVAVSSDVKEERGSASTIEVFSADGTHLKSIGIWKYMLKVGSGLAADSAGNLYIDVSAGCGVLIFSALTGDLVGWIEHVGGGLLYTCVALCSDGAMACVKTNEVHLFRSVVTEMME